MCLDMFSIYIVLYKWYVSQWQHKSGFYSFCSWRTLAERSVRSAATHRLTKQIGPGHFLLCKLMLEDLGFCFSEGSASCYRMGVEESRAPARRVPKKLPAA